MTDQEKTFNQRVGEIRGNKAAASARLRAAELEAAGMSDSAIRAQNRAQRAFDRQMDRANLKDYLQENYDGASNTGEAYQKYRDQMQKEGRLPGDGKAFEDWVKDQAKADKGKAGDPNINENQDPGGGGGGGGGDRSDGKLDTIIRIMTERLPIRVLAA